MMLTPGIEPAAFPPDLPPLLLVVIDTEEEFDWSAPFDRASRAVDCIGEQHRAQSVLEAYGIVPTYVIDHPVASTPASSAVFRDWSGAGRCIVGTHLHPWVSPPDDEEVCTRHSYPGNLPAPLEYAKLKLLTEVIERNVGLRPDIYKAGRYGLGPHTAEALHALEYKIDLSVLASTDLSQDGGPDYRGYPHTPYWFGPDGGLFEVPLTRGYPGALGRMGETVYNAVSGALAHRLHIPGILARTGLVERIALTPEGITLEENKRLVRHLLARGRRIFTYAYHSSSLLPGGSPYVRHTADRDRFLDAMDAFCRFFAQEIGGRGTTPYEIRDLARRT